MINQNCYFTFHNTSHEVDKKKQKKVRKPLIAASLFRSLIVQKNKTETQEEIFPKYTSNKTPKEKIATIKQKKKMFTKKISITKNSFKIEDKRKHLQMY